jgi:spoIIIJ-associated protein
MDRSELKSHGEFTGATLDEALTEACGALRARVGELHYEVIESEESGVSIRAEVDPVAVLGLFMSEALHASGLDIKVRLDERDDVLKGELSGEDTSILVTGGGRGLDALQYLCNRVLNRRMEDHAPVHLDTNGFKSRRARKLRAQAEEAAAEAIRRRRPVRLGPLTPAARREIHLALADHPRVETESDGEGFIKKVVIRPRRWR